MTANRYWTLARRPKGTPRLGDLALATHAVPDLEDGQVLVRNILLSADPSQLTRMRDGSDALPLGSAIPSRALGVVERSLASAFRVGDVVRFLRGYDATWSEWSLGDCRTLSRVPPGGGGVGLEAWLSVLGGPGLTAWFGIEIGDPRPGETVVIEAAAGAVGSVAAQLARARGARVVGVASGAKKQAWLTEVLGLDAVIDRTAHPSQDTLDAALAQACPRGIDVHFINAGGAVLDAGLANLAMGARLVLCGLIARHQDAAASSVRLEQMLYCRARLQGFILGDFKDRFDSAHQELFARLTKGELVWRADVAQGLGQVPQAFIRMFAGGNTGKTLIRLAPDPT